MAIGKQNEAVADPLCVQQLMDCKGECPAVGDLHAQHVDDLTSSPKIEAVERFVHKKQWVRREQSQRQHEPSAVALRQRMHALVKNRLQTNCFNRTRDLVGRSSIDIGKER